MKTIRDLSTHPDPHVSVGALARYYGVSPSTIYRHIVKGALQVSLVGPEQLIRIPIDEARRYGHPNALQPLQSSHLTK